MKKVVCLLTLCVMLFMACQDESVNKSVFTMDEVVRTTEGATFQAKILVLDAADYDDYGFVWSAKREPTIADSVFYFKHAPQPGKFSREVRNDLVEGLVYNVRSFIKAKGKIIYSNTVRFESLGSASPVITGFSPGHGGSLDSIKITGSNFSKVITNVQVQIGEAPVELLAASRNELLVRLPYEFTSGSFPLKVEVSGKSSVSRDNFILDGPIVHSVAPLSGPGGTVMTINGDGFSPDVLGNRVLWDGRARMEVISATSTELRVMVPYHDLAGVKNLSVEVNHATTIVPAAFTLTGPVITSFYPLSGIQGSLVTLKGSGFSPVPTQNLVSIGGWAGSSEVISASENELVVRVGYATYAGNVNCLVSVNGTPGVAAQEFTIVGPEITEIIPGAQYGGRTIKVLGKNFKAEPYITSAYFMGSPTDGVPVSFSDTEIEIKVPLDLQFDTPIVIQAGGITVTTPFDFHVLSPWVKQSDFPGAARYGAVGFSIGQYGFVGTGMTTTGDSRDFWRYDTVAKTWKQLNNFPGGSRMNAFSFVIDGKAYVGGGGHYRYADQYPVNEFSDLWEYDPANDTWTQKKGPDLSNMASNSRPNATSLDHAGYVCIDHYMHRYDAETDSWTRSYAPVANSGFAHVIGRKLYFADSWNNGDTYQYDPDSGPWTYLANWALDYTTTSFQINDKLYVSNYYGSKEYDPVTQSFRNMPTSRWMIARAATFTIGRVGYAVTGLNYQPTETFVTFDPDY